MLHRRAFKVSVAWTLALLWLGSVVHATESSLACPDWPTCFGTMVPEMTGGVFWEHLHRLVAGGLLLMWGLATWLAHKETTDRPWIFRAALGGVALLLVQSLFGGLTVLFRLPDWISTTHLTLALSFLALATVLASATSRAGSADDDAGPDAGADVGTDETTRRLSVAAPALVLAQSVLGGLVRHMDAGMACPDVPLCLGRVVPPLVNAPITVHFVHRVLALIAVGVVLALLVRARSAPTSPAVRRWTAVAAALVLVQVGLGVASVLTTLAVLPVSLHTLVAASLLATLVHVAVLARAAGRGRPAHGPATPAMVA
ncbi:MAG: heme A synthase [Gemmatimonadales bacterium]